MWLQPSFFSMTARHLLHCWNFSLWTASLNACSALSGSAPISAILADSSLSYLTYSHVLPLWELVSIMHSMQYDSEQLGQVKSLQAFSSFGSNMKAYLHPSVGHQFRSVAPPIATFRVVSSYLWYMSLVTISFSSSSDQISLHSLFGQTISCFESLSVTSR